MKSHLKCLFWACCSFQFCQIDIAASTVDVLGNIEQSSATSFVFRPNQGSLQWVVSSTLLSSLSVNDRIVGIAFRLDGSQATSQPGTDISFLDWNLQLSQSAHSPGALSTTFTDNQGSDVTTVRSGPLLISSEAFPTSINSPKPWGTVIEFQTPYTYLGGDLLFTLHAITGVTGSGIVVDAAANTPNDQLPFLYQAISSLGYTATGGGLGATPVFQVVVPEPSVFSLVSVTVCFCIHRRRKAN